MYIISFAINLFVVHVNKEINKYVSTKPNVKNDKPIKKETSKVNNIIKIGIAKIHK